MFSRKVNGITSCPSSDRKAINKVLRIRLAAAYRGLDAYGLNEGVFNHLSAIAPSSTIDEDIMLILPSHLHWSEITPTSLLEINKEGAVVAGDGEPDRIILPTHQAIYRKRPDVKAAMHTHMPYATALACLQEPKLLMLHQSSIRFHNRVAFVDPYVGLDDDAKESELVAEFLQEKDVLLERHHGVWIVADSIETAFNEMYCLERAAMFQILAFSTQKELKEIDETTAEETCKKLLKEAPDYARRHLDSAVRRFGSWKDLISNNLPL